MEHQLARLTAPCAADEEVTHRRELSTRGEGGVGREVLPPVPDGVLQGEELRERLSSCPRRLSGSARTQPRQSAAPASASDGSVMPPEMGYLGYLNFSWFVVASVGVLQGCSIAISQETLKSIFSL